MVKIDQYVSIGTSFFALFNDAWFGSICAESSSSLRMHLIPCSVALIVLLSSTTVSCCFSKFAVELRRSGTRWELFPPQRILSSGASSSLYNNIVFKPLRATSVV
ncbi:hypothetical protein PRUPE_5G131000 [Prunus persica]|uniref:Uncharacterized protein n=1 Tax=Prunus persica TaxID=3760 RepID=A0A251P7Q4_PRUPE|nr:hypothetical protein PRUPE_5G131000 [Prunus persica]